MIPRYQLLNVTTNQPVPDVFFSSILMARSVRRAMNVHARSIRYVVIPGPAHDKRKTK
jgi:hypothetical protein